MAARKRGRTTNKKSKPARRPTRTAPKRKPAAKVVAPKAKKRRVAASTAKKTAAKKTAAKKKATRGGPAPKRARAPAPSERALSVSAARPFERSLTDEERDAMAKVASTAKRFAGLQGAPPSVVRGIAMLLEEIRGGAKEPPASQDVRLGLGVLWGEQLRAQVGWTWVHLTYPDGFASYALVPDDRAFACFPLNRVPELMADASRSNTSLSLFESIRTGTLPMRKTNAYLVIG